MAWLGRTLVGVIGHLVLVHCAIQLADSDPEHLSAGGGGLGATRAIDALELVQKILTSILIYHLHYMLALIVVVLLVVSNWKFRQLIALILMLLHMLHIKQDPVYATFLLLLHSAAAATGAPRIYYTIPLIFLMVQGTAS